METAPERKSAKRFSIFAGVLAIPFSLILAANLPLESLIQGIIMLFLQGVIPTFFAYILGKKIGKFIITNSSFGNFKSLLLGAFIAFLTGILAIVSTYLLSLPLIYFDIIHYRAISGIMVNFVMSVPLYMLWGAVAGLSLKPTQSK